MDWPVCGVYNLNMKINYLKIIIGFVVAMAIVIIFQLTISINKSSTPGILDENKNRALENRELQIGNNSLKVELADTETKRNLGLSGRGFLEDNHGMLFVDFMPPTLTPAFWMKDMNFDIDIIWIKDNQIIGITENVPKPVEKNNLPLYYPPSAIDSVLEVNAGWSKTHQLKNGDKVELKK